MSHRRAYWWNQAFKLTQKIVNPDGIVFHINPLDYQEPTKEQLAYLSFHDELLKSASRHYFGFDPASGPDVQGVTIVTEDGKHHPAHRILHPQRTVNPPY
jgi:hypothetical protein